MSGQPTKPLRYPGIPAIQQDDVLAPTVRALVEAVELLTGVRAGGKLQAAKATDMTSQLAEINRRLIALGG